jgi:hypothetical protein
MNQRPLTVAVVIVFILIVLKKVGRHRAARGSFTLGSLGGDHVGGPRVQVGQADRDMRRPPTDQVSHTSGSGHESFDHRAAVTSSIADKQVAHIADPSVLGIGHGTFENLLEHPSASVRHVLEDGERVVGILTPDKIQEGPNLAH